MKIIIIALFVLIFVVIHCIAERNYFVNEFHAQKGFESLKNVKQWRENIRKNINDMIQNLPAKDKKTLIENADDHNGHPWESLKLSDYLGYTKVGDRNVYEMPVARRRQKLADLIIGELLTNNGKYINQIANGLWLTMEETSWVVPAHIGEGIQELHNPKYYDLFAAETAAEIAWIRLLMHDKLSKYAPHDMLIKRIDYELHRRIVTPFLNYTLYWMLYSWNWNIWIETNTLEIALLAIDDESIRNHIINKTLYNSDKFLNPYNEDGGCDEGPAYWIHAGGRLIKYIDLLNSASNGALSWSNNQLIHRIGQYEAKMHINENYFVNFADASGIITPPPFSLAKYGKIFNDAKMLEFAAYINARTDVGGDNSIIHGIMQLFIEQLFANSLLKNIDPKAPYFKESYMNHLGVLTLRSNEGSSKGIFLGAKGGHNGEYHNHNDVGNFVFYANGQPAIIDVGVGTYVRDTFSGGRYKIWTMQSEWHNLPSINGADQHDGSGFKAMNVSYTKDGEINEFSMDIGHAYPKAAEVNYWKRKFLFNGGANTLTLVEEYSLKQWVKPFQLHYITVLHNIDADTKGKLKLKDIHNITSLEIEYDQIFDVHLDRHIISDDLKLNHTWNYWGNSVTRITMVPNHKLLESTFTTVFKLI